MLYKTESIVIKKNKLGEYDNLLAVYTKDFGKLVLKAKSVRKQQAKLSGHLELFIHNHLTIAPSRKLDVVTGAETIDGFYGLHNDLTSLTAASYLSELTNGLIMEKEQDKQVWELLLFGFRKLNKKDDIKMTVEIFEKKLLELLGYGYDPKRNAVRFIESLMRKRLESRKLLTELL